MRVRGKEVLGGGLEPPCLSAYAPQTYVSAISPPEQRDEFFTLPDGRILARQKFRLMKNFFCEILHGSHRGGKFHGIRSYSYRR